MQEHKPNLIDVQQELFPDFDSMVMEMLEEWQVPGLAVGVVKDDRLIFAKGYGVRTVGGQEAVTEQTIFATGSVTKSFTAAAIGALVDDGKVQWDDSVIKYLPDFQLADPYVTQEITVRDLLCARGGLGGGHLMVYGEGHDRAEIVRRLHYLKALQGFRVAPGEHTFHFLIASQLVEEISKQSWDDFLRERILLPLGMHASRTMFAETLRAANLATPHFPLHGEIVSVPWYNSDHHRGAGGLSANVVDLAQWVRFHLTEGSYQGQRVLSREVIHEMHTPQIIDRSGLARSLNPEAHVVTYGLSHFVHDYRGHRVIEHGGAPFGMHAVIALLPEEQLGLVLLINASMRRDMLAALKLQIFDHYLGRPLRNWSTEYLSTWRETEVHQQTARVRASEELDARRIVGTQPALALEKYAGVYEDTYYGKARISLENGRLVFHYGTDLYAELEHWHYDTFKANWRVPFSGEDLFTFSLDCWGEVVQVASPDFGAFQRI